ncbi:MAG: homoserine O-acetyltransferase, partial [Odoribacter sp.]|nr:homoserine O-acetyltransferase [Odoribacter sp.]
MISSEITLEKRPFTKKITFNEPFKMECGSSLPAVTVAYETYGKLNDEGTNVIMVCHALTGDAHASSYCSSEYKGEVASGWWDGAIGVGKAFDPEKYFIICSNILGSCYGSTGPYSVNPETGKRYKTAFPQMTVRDIVHVQYKLITHLGIKKIKSIAGGSLGGMQALEWTLLYPDYVESIIPIAVGARHSAWAIGLNEIQRKVITEDPEWNNGNYDKQPNKGLETARMLGMITFRTPESFQKKFGRRVKNEADNNLIPFYEVESYLRYQGEKLVNRYDANTYLYISRTCDLHDVSKNRGSLEDALGQIKAKT